MRPVSLLHVGSFLRKIARSQGPDVPCRIVESANVLEIALLGKVAIGTSTPREALTRVAIALPVFCSHEHLILESKATETVVRQFYTTDFDAETTHLLHQYVVAIADRLCAMTGAKRPLLQEIQLQPHPKFGLRHLWDRYGERLVPTEGRSVNILIDNAVFDHPFRKIGRDRMSTQAALPIEPLRGDGSLCSSARTYIHALIEDGRKPSIKLLASAAGTSVRTFQRQLSEEGRSFSELLEEERHSATLDRMNAENTTLGSISADMGYSDQASLTRAFRRWTGISPSKYRTRYSETA